MKADLRNLDVGPAELAGLLSRTQSTINGWAKTHGLPRNPDGTFNLKRAVLWLDGYRKAKWPAQRFQPLTQFGLANVLGQSRQWVIARRRDGLPRRADGLYDLQAVCRWLPTFYESRANAKYHRRLETMRKKLSRNVRQLERFLAGTKAS